MRRLRARDVAEKVYELCIKVNTRIPSDIRRALESALPEVRSESARVFLSALLENARIARKTGLPLCQDTGLVVVFVELGKDTCIQGDLVGEVNRAVERAYRDAHLRRSVVRDPVERTPPAWSPALIHLEPTRRRRTRIVVLAKGFGSENKSRLYMLLPTAKEDEIVEAVVSAIRSAGASACPPFVVGVGIGGTSDKAMLLAKRALCMRIEGPYRGDYPELAREIRDRANELGIGVLGLGEGPTVLGVNILSAPTHIAGLPVGVNIGCHSTRWGEVLV